MMGKNIPSNAAIGRAQKGLDTWSTTQSGAKSVASGAKKKTPIGPEKDQGGAGKFCHYHPAKRTPNSHAFFGTLEMKC
jgi:hypothetical protein